MHAFFINLDRHPERRAFLEAQLQKAGIAAERVSGVDGNDVPPELAGYYDLASRSRDALRPNEIGCHASHMLIWKIIVERNLDYALVLEDDATLPSDLEETLDEIVRAMPRTWDLVRLCNRSKASIRPLAPLPGGGHLVRYSRVPLGSAAYLVSKDGARKLLLPRVVRSPLDKEISQSWLFDLDLYGVAPNPIFQERIALQSTIGPDRGGIPRLQRLLMGGSKFRYNFSKLGPAWWARCCAQNVAMKLRLMSPRHRGIAV